MHYANLKKSKRLQRVYRLLSNKKKYSTRDIIIKANVCAVNSAVSELRRNGVDIEYAYDEKSKICKYKMLRGLKRMVYAV